MELTKEQIIIDTLGARIGQLMVENVSLLARVHELEQAAAERQEPPPEEENP